MRRPKTKPQPGPGPGRDHRGQLTRGQRILQGNPATCRAKADYLKAQQRARRHAKVEAQKTDRAEIQAKLRAGLALARAKAPADPNARHRLVLLLGAEQLAEAEAQILQAHPHLSRERDGALISSLTTLNMVCRTAWAVFGSGTARLGYATRAGKLSWNRGLTTLLNLEAARMKLANELAITPQSKRQLGLSVEVGEGSEVVVIAGDTQEYINKLRALRGAPPLPLPETIAVPDHSTSALAFYGKKPEGEA